MGGFLDDCRYGKWDPAVILLRYKQGRVEWMHVFSMRKFTIHGLSFRGISRLFRLFFRGVCTGGQVLFGFFPFRGRQQRRDEATH